MCDRCCMTYKTQNIYSLAFYKAGCHLIRDGVPSLVPSDHQDQAFSFWFTWYLSSPCPQPAPSCQQGPVQGSDRWMERTFCLAFFSCRSQQEWICPTQEGGKAGWRTTVWEWSSSGSSIWDLRLWDTENLKRMLQNFWQKCRSR